MAKSVHIDLLKGRIILDDDPAALTPKQLELLGLLALRKRPVSCHEIIEAVWSQADIRAALSTLKVFIHRIRRLCAPQPVIRSAPSGYAIADGVTTDIQLLEQLALESRFRSALEPVRIAELRSAFVGLTSALALNMPAILEDRARALFAEIGERLGAAALRCGNSSEALAIADSLTALDCCDESGWELAIRAHLLAGDRCSAMRTFRRYERLLAAELGIVPSPEVRHLLSADYARSATIHPFASQEGTALSR